MYELIQVADNNYYVNCPTKVGIYCFGDNEALLIDSGADKDVGRKVFQAVQKLGKRVSGIFLTHSNADHAGGAKLIQDRFGCKAFAPGLESAVVNYPVLEPAILYGGNPPKALRNKFLMVKAPCKSEEFSQEKLPEGVSAVPLPGHFLDMQGIITPEGVFYCGDCVFSTEVVNKYHVTFCYDVKASMDTLAKLTDIDAKIFIPAHAEPTENIKELAEINLGKMKEIIAFLLEICRTGRSYEEILACVFDNYSLKMDFNQNVLVGSTIKSYLSYLLDEGMLRAEFVNNRLMWKSLAV